MTLGTLDVFACRLNRSKFVQKENLTHQSLTERGQLCKPESSSTPQCSWIPTHQCKGWWLFASWGTMQGYRDMAALHPSNFNAVAPSEAGGSKGKFLQCIHAYCASPLRKSEQKPAIYWDRHVCNECGNGIVHVVPEGDVPEGPLSPASFTVLV